MNILKRRNKMGERERRDSEKVLAGKKIIDIKTPEVV